MEVYAIVLKGVDISQHGFSVLQQSSKKVGNKFIIHEFEAITPDYVDKTMVTYGIKWNYPWDVPENDFASGLVKTPYVTANPKARIAAALSHYSLWKRAIKLDQPILVLEHDAKFITKLDIDPQYTRYDIIGINDPRGATRKSARFHEMVQKNKLAIQRAPEIDEPTIPQGIAGNSAYIIKPAGAKRLLELVKEYGLWPNDAIMCRQLIPRLGVSRKYYTTIQGLKSTTTL